ncbi:MAG: SGNH/GDSL hydrolase family protein [Capsulimonadaceae bacterium]|nr:SGNH/GDSL hydrolase family protein [Capsulimonadaceae bacterium]
MNIRIVNLIMLFAVFAATCLAANTYAHAEQPSLPGWDTLGKPGGWNVSDPERVTLKTGGDEAPYLEVTVPPETPTGTQNATYDLPLSKFAGTRVEITVEVRAKNVTQPAQPWLGIKAMLHVAASSQKDSFPQAAANTTSSPMNYDWKSLSFQALIPPTATVATLNLGLQQAAGTVDFRNPAVRIIGHVAQTSKIDIDKLKSEFMPASIPTVPVSPNAYRILFIGDSITRHGTNAEILSRLKWDHVAGMAASDESKDYVHLLAGKIRATLNGRDVAILVTGVASGEQLTPAERLKPVVEAAGDFKPDLVVFQHGEHEPESNGVDGLAKTYNAVLDYVLGLPSHPKIACIGNWQPDSSTFGYEGWAGKIADTMRQICGKRGIPFASVSSYASDPACHGWGETPGVQWHPNDLGHLGYAKAAFAIIEPLLPTRAPKAK